VVPGTLVDIPGGAFAMGCDPTAHPECDADEAPVHTVTLSAFRIEATEVTVAQWRACVDAYACGALPGALGADDEPVVAVTVDVAEGYCAWQRRRLPTEAQWERAARGPDGGLYPWGDDEPDCDRVASRECDGGVTPVATHPAGVSPEGVYDMAGNAWEWVSDGYIATYYSASPATDPEADLPGGEGVLRGVDSWSSPAALRATNREMAISDAASSAVGFRCVEAE
jgi:formylglycine-generating enzyme required for sulfatase activity